MKCFLVHWQLNLLVTWLWFSFYTSPSHAHVTTSATCSDVMIVSTYSEIIDAIDCNPNIIQIENNITVLGTIFIESLTNLKFIGNGHYLTSNEIQTFRFINCTDIEIINLKFYSQIQTEALIGFFNSSVLLSEVRGDQNQAPLLWIDSSQIHVSQSNFTNTVSYFAGAIYCVDSDLQIYGTTFSQNEAPGGAAVGAHHCNLIIMQSIFQNNTVSHSGGAISVEFSTVSISNSLFVGNSCGDETLPSSSYSGGAIHDVGSRMSFNKVQFISNIAYGTGGAISLTSENGLFENCEFLSNKALDGGALMLSDGSYQLLDCLVNGNKANVLVTSGNGGGIYVSHSTIVVERLECTENQAIVSGGCFYLTTNFSLSCQDCQLLDNKAGTSVGSGGAISAIGRSPYQPSLSLSGTSCNISSNSGASGGGIASSLTILTARNCLISSNTGVSGGGIYLQSMHTVDLQQLQLVNNVASGPGGGIFSIATDLLIKDSQVNLNQAMGSQSGGGLYLGSQSTLYLESVTLSGNSAGTASTLLATDSSRIYLNNSSVFDNIARQSGTIYIRSFSQLSVTNSTFVDNIGGATAGVAYCTSYSVCSFSSCSFSSNLALTYGGVVVVDLWAEVSFLNCVLSDNEGREAGGSLYATTYGQLILENVTVSGSSSVGKGGVAFLSTFGSMKISNSDLNSNSAAIGGAIHAEFNADFDLHNVSMIDNYASYLGGVISALDSIEFTGSNLQFYNNHALYGGCLYLLIECSVELNHIHSRNNSAVLQGGFVRAAGLVFLTIHNSVLEDHRGEYGGVADLSSKGVEFSLWNSIVRNNIAEQYGGFISVTDGALLKIYSCQITNNEAIFGGGLYISNGFAAIDNSIFEANVAIDSGGVAKIYSGNVSIENSIFQSNRALDSGGVFHCERSSFLTVRTSTFLKNIATENGGVFYSSDETQLISISNNFTMNLAMAYGGLVYSEKRGIISFVSSLSMNNSAAYAGGSFYLRNNFNVSLMNSSFIDDSASDISSGGALHLSNPLEVLITKTIFQNCKGGNGAAIQIDGSNSLHLLGMIVIQDSTFENNQFTTAAMNTTTRYAKCMDGTSGNGGAIYLKDNTDFSQVDIISSTFLKNFGCNGGAITVTGGRGVRVKSCNFVENVATVGGGAMFWKVSSPLPLITTESITNTNNKAMYGSLIATDKSKLAMTHDGNLESSGHVFQSPVTIYVQDYYQQTVTSDLTSFVVINSRDASVVSGSTIIRATNGIAKFKEITITSTIGGKASMLFIISGTPPIGALRTFYFRNCTLGEIPQNAGLGLWNGNQIQLTQCYYCPSGSYALKKTSTVCLDCPNNANCLGGNTIDVKKGYWRVSNSSDEILKCKGTTLAACKGGSNGPYTCTEGNKGPYCTLCKDGYLVTIDGTCRQCSGESSVSSLGFILAITLLSLLCLLLLIAWLYRHHLMTSFQSTYHRITDALESQSSKIKILFAFTQIISQFPTVLALPRIPFFSTLTSYLGILSFNLLSYFKFQCEIQVNFYDKLLFITLLPLVLTPLLYLFYYLKAFFALLQNSNNPSFSYWDAKRKATYSFLVILFVIFAPSSTIILQTFVCEEFDDGTSYMYADYHLSCHTNTHQFYVLYAAFMVLLYPIGIPLFYLYLLWSNLSAINPPTKRVVKETERHIVSSEIIQLEKLNLRDNDDNITHLSFLFESYRPGAWYFEVIECLRRLFLTAIPSLILPGTAVQTIIVLIFSMIFSFLYAELKPFVVHSDSIAAIGAEWGLTLTLLMGLIITVSDYEDSLATAAKSLIGLVMIGVNLGTMIFTIYVSIFNEDDKQKKALDKFKSSRTRKRSSSNLNQHSRHRKRGTNETLLNKVRLSFKKSFRRSGVDTNVLSALESGERGEVENPAIVELTEVKEDERRGGGGRGISGGEGLFHRHPRSRLKYKTRDSDDESDSDDSSDGNAKGNAAAIAASRSTRGVIRSNPHDSMEI